MLQEEIHQPSFIDGDDSGLVGGPAPWIIARKWPEEFSQDVVVSFVTFVLAAVIIALESMSFELEDGSVGTVLYLSAFTLGECLELLNKGGLPITCITADDHQPELALEQCRFQFFIQEGGHIGRLADLIQPSRSGIGNLTLAVKGQEVGDKRVGVGRYGFEPQLAHCFRSDRDLIGGQHRAITLHLAKCFQKLCRRRKTVLALRGDHLDQHLDQRRTQVGAPLELPGVLGLSPDRWCRFVKGIVAGQTLVEGQPQSIEVTVDPIFARRLPGVVIVRRQIASGTAATLNFVLLADRHVEIDNPHTLVGPKEVGGLNILVVHAVPVQVFQPFSRFTHDPDCIVQRKSLGLNQIGNIKAFHIFKNDVGRLLGVAHAICPYYFHHMRMIGQVGKGLVLPAQAFIDASTVPGHQFDNANHIAQRIKHLVGHTEAPATKLRLDSETVGQNEILGQIGQVIGDLLCRLYRAAQHGCGLILGLRQDQVIQRLPGHGGARVAILRVKFAEFLQPFVYALGQIRFVCGRLNRELAVRLHHLIHILKGQFTGQQFIEDKPGGIEVRCDAGLCRVLETLRGLVTDIQVIHDLLGDSGGAVFAHPGEVKGRDPGLATLGDDNSVGRKIPMDHLVSVGVIQRIQHISHDLKFLVESQSQRCLIDVLAEGLSSHVLCDQHNLIFIVVDKKVFDRKHVRMRGHVSNSSVSVADLPEFFFSGRFILIRIGLIDPQPGHAAALAQKVVLGAVFGKTVGAAEFLYHLPVAEYQSGAFGLGLALNGFDDLGMETADIIKPVVRNAAGVTKIFQTTFEVSHIRTVDSCRVIDRGVIGGQQYRGMDMGLAQIGKPRVALPDNGSHGLGVIAKLGQR